MTADISLRLPHTGTHMCAHTHMWVPLHRHTSMHTTCKWQWKIKKKFSSLQKHLNERITRREFCIWEMEENLLFFLETTGNRIGDPLDTTRSPQCCPAFLVSSWRLEEGRITAQLPGCGQHTLNPRPCPICSTPQWAGGSASGLDAGRQSPCLSLPLTSFDHFYSR